MQNYCRKIFSRAVLIFAIGMAVAHFCFFLPNTLKRTDKGRDSLAYYLVMERIHNNEPIYAGLSEQGPHSPAYPLFLYPPVLAGALSVLPHMTFPVFARFWTILLYGAFWVYSATLGKLASGRVTVSGTLVAASVLYFFPGAFRALELGQVDPLLWAFFGLALSFPVSRGFFTMAISIIKPWGIWPFLWSLTEGYRVWVGALLVLAGSAIMGTLVMGGVEFVGACHDWLTNVLPSVAQGTWSSDNRSLSFAVLRIAHSAGLWSYEGGALPFWARNWLLACGIGGPLLTGWCFRRKQKKLQLTAVGCIAILASPICWTTYLPVLLTFTAVLFHSVFRMQKSEIFGDNAPDAQRESSWVVE